MSPSFSQSSNGNNAASWKQEVSQRLAAHRVRRSNLAVAPQTVEEPRPAATKASRIAARVAARYAQAPDYSETQAAEAQVAVRVAEMATQMALKAQAEAQAALATLHAAAPRLVPARPLAAQPLAVQQQPLQRPAIQPIQGVALPRKTAAVQARAFIASPGVTPANLPLAAEPATLQEAVHELVSASLAAEPLLPSAQEVLESVAAELVAAPLVSAQRISAPLQEESLVFDAEVAPILSAEPAEAVALAEPAPTSEPEPVAVRFSEPLPGTESALVFQLDFFSAPTPVEPRAKKRAAAPVATPQQAPAARVEPVVAAPHADLDEDSDSASLSFQDWWEPVEADDVSLSFDPGTAFEPIEPEQPIPANLIEFPRELVATRKMRPRLADSPLRQEPDACQLSIFEVDPMAVSTRPESAAPVSGPRWQNLELDALDEQPLMQPEEEPVFELGDDPVRSVALHTAPYSDRLLAAVVDGALILGAFNLLVLIAFKAMQHLPSLRVAELLGAAGLLLTALAFQLAFALGADATPGMRYAHLSLCTFDDEFPTTKQRCQRAAAVALSLAPLGLGFWWSFFDGEALAWHDRMSRTYQRQD